MVTINGLNFTPVICWLLVLNAAFSSSQNAVVYQNSARNEKRSLNNYVVSSIPYIVDNKTMQPPSTEWQPEKDKQTSNDHNEAQCIGEGHCTRNVSITDSSVEATFRPYSQDELNKILKKYEGDKNIQPEESNKISTYYSSGNSNNIQSAVPNSADHHEKSKSWNLLNNENYKKNPYNDRMGWVTLEPIAWSSSQVQKWEPNQKPMWPSPSQASNAQWHSALQQQQLQPSYSWTTDLPWKRPSYQYQAAKPWNSNQNYKPQNPNEDIITDGQPGYFPPDRHSETYKPWPDKNQGNSYSENSNRPPTQVVYQGSADRPPSGSSDGDGHWVLLSSTKGYSVPHRPKSIARSLDNIEEEPLKKPKPHMQSRRTVRLTVLPPLPGSTKTITSHGGMIEVESTRQTVDEAHREHLARMLKYQNATSSNEIPKAESHFHVAPAKADSLQSTRRNTLLAAVSAGMIPATMAMLLPLLIGRRKRSLPEPEPKIVTLKFKKFDTPGIATRYTRRESKDWPRKKVFTKSYTIYQ